MAEGGYKKDLSCSTLIGSEDTDLSHSIQMGSQDCYEYYCQPCDVDHNQVEATFYCNNCHEYMCRKCNMYHKKFKELNDHEILDVKHMTYKPPVSKNRLASTKAVTMATHVKDITVASYIGSSALMSTNQLLVADRDNNKVILVDTVSGRHVSELKLSGQPHQLTRISNTEAAVTVPRDKKIVLLKTQPQLSVDKEIRVQGKYRGIAYMDNTLIVTFEEGHVGILDMSGRVLRIISTDQTGMEIFRYPHYLTVDPATGNMYVSDRGELLGLGTKVVKLSKEGSMLATYTGDRGGCPNQVTLDTQGMIYVAWRDTVLGESGCVEQLSASCDKVMTILPDQSPWPQALSYDEATQQLYVGQQNGVVKVYRLS